MVIKLNKWCFTAFAVVFLFATPSAKAELKPVKPHPVHIATVEIDHNATDKTLEITCKTFWDDFEDILSRINKSRVDLTSEKARTENNQKVFNYIKAHLQIIVDGKAIPLEFVGFEKEDVVVYSYLQASNVNTVKQINITSSLMHDIFDDQSEIIHVVVNGKRQSTKLDYPASKANFSF
ncbi:MAG: hypothetical protein BWZ05_00436 [Bacteroidetes bacterium ADurb.BinA245]|jgi:hypothetical protein|nr:hypothetical protein [Chitinophagaceae bacterium]OPZ18959.1 MAG: hypothetical protein BWZ05_00436 [Bacteroidetes bacterium ADurb.BinA245]HRF23820.1 hypothetical protein [Chitinophagaceae bacterium]